MTKLTEPQLRLLRRLETEDGVGIVRQMPFHERQVAYRLKDLGLVELDGQIASSVTEDTSSYSGLTFVVTDNGREVLAKIGGQAQ